MLDWFSRNLLVRGYDSIIIVSATAGPSSIGTPELLRGSGPRCARVIALNSATWRLVPDHDDGTGLAAYRLICAQAAAYLAPNGWLMVEIGHKQGHAVQELFRAAGLADIALRYDLSGHPRVVMGRAAV